MTLSFLTQKSKNICQPMTWSFWNLPFSSFLDIVLSSHKCWWGLLKKKKKHTKRLMKYNQKSLCNPEILSCIQLCSCSCCSVSGHQCDVSLEWSCGSRLRNECQLSALSASSAFLFMESESTSRVDASAAAVRYDWMHCPTHAFSVRKELNGCWLHTTLVVLAVNGLFSMN